MTRVSDGPRRRRMIRGTIARIGELSMRYGQPSQLATLDCTSSRRSTVMCALPRATVVTTEYQRDSSSKRPRSSVVSAARTDARPEYQMAERGLSSSRGRLPSPSSHRTGLVGLTSGSSGRRGQQRASRLFRRQPRGPQLFQRKRQLRWSDDSVHLAVPGAPKKRAPVP